jgi:SAM-dependent methyltransferase
MPFLTAFPLNPYKLKRPTMQLITKRFSLLLAATTLLFCAAAQAQNKDFTPSVGQEGKDVIWVPTPVALVQKMLDMAKATANDYVIDLGSGDGVTVINAAKRGIRALGIEYNPDMVEHAKRNAQKESAAVGGRAEFVQGDIFQTDFSKATVLTMYLLPSLNLKLRPTILNMKPGTRIVSHAFTMGDWEADQTDNVEGRTAYLWIVPAKVDGAWRMEGGDITFKQTFQKIEGTVGGKAITSANLRGDTIAFSADGREYSGKVTGDRMEGTVKGSTAGKWSAARAK